MSHVWHCQHRLLSGAIWGLPKRHSHHNSSSLACSGLNRSSATFCLKCTQGMEVSLKCGSYFYLAFFFPRQLLPSQGMHTHTCTQTQWVFVASPQGKDIILRPQRRAYCHTLIGQRALQGPSAELRLVHDIIEHCWFALPLCPSWSAFA